MRTNMNISDHNFYQVQVYVHADHVVIAYGVSTADVSPESIAGT